MAHIRVSQEGEKKRRLDFERTNPDKTSPPIWAGKSVPKLTPEQVTKSYQDNFRSGNKFKPGRVSNPYREYYDDIKWEKN